MAEHDDLLRKLDRLEIVIVPAWPEPAAAMRARTDLARALVTHLANEDAAIYPRLSESKHLVVAEIARQFADEFEALAENWSTHCATWTAEAAASRWPQFCAATQAVIACIRRRIMRENTELYPAALAASLIALRSRNDFGAKAA